MKVNSDNFLNYINSKSNLHQFILFYGPNYGLVSLLFNDTLKKLSIDTNDPFGVSKLNTSNLIDKPSSLTDSLSTYSMISNQRSVLLDLCNYPLSKSLSNIIISALQLEIANSIVIIKADNLGSQSELVKFATSYKLGLLVPCYDEPIININIKLTKIFNDYNLKFNNDFISFLSSKFSSDSYINSMELDKLRIFLINNNNIDETSLLNLINDNKDLNINKIAFYTANGDSHLALFHYEKIIQSTIPPLLIIKVLLKHFKILENILSIVNNGNNIEYAINTIRPAIFFKDKHYISMQVKLWTKTKILMVMKKLIDTEIKCKSSIINDKILIAQLILSISVMAKKAIKP